MFKAKLTGAGFGGACVALVKAGAGSEVSYVYRKNSMHRGDNGGELHSDARLLIGQ